VPYIFGRRELARLLAIAPTKRAMRRLCGPKQGNRSQRRFRAGRADRLTVELLQATAEIMAATDKLRANPGHSAATIVEATRLVRSNLRSLIPRSPEHSPEQT